MVLSITLIVIAVALGVGTYFSNKVMYPKTLTHEESLERSLKFKRFDTAYLDSFEKEEISVDSHAGYNLYGWWIPTPNAKGTMIICHGITCTLYDSIKYMTFFREWGFNILIYDHQNHGESGGTYTAYGFEEKFDLQLMVDFVQGRVSKDHIIGTHGESMGAATVLQHASIDPRISFVIADCSFKSGYDIFKYRLHKDFHLPAFPILEIANLVSQLKIGIPYRKMSPMESIKKTTTPILLIHGKADKYVPAQHSIEMYEASKDIGYRELYLVEGAGHAKAYETDPETYKQKIKAFIDCVLMTSI